MKRLCKFCTRAKPAERFRYHTELMCEQCAIDRGVLIPCTGAAHLVGGGLIDHCPVCAARWGWMERIPIVIDVELLKEQPPSALLPMRLGVKIYLDGTQHIAVNFMSVDRDTGLFSVRAEGGVIHNFTFHELTAADTETLAEALRLAARFARCSPLLNRSRSMKAVYGQLLAELKAARILTGQEESEDE